MKSREYILKEQAESGKMAVSEFADEVDALVGRVQDFLVGAEGAFDRMQKRLDDLRMAEQTYQYMQVVKKVEDER